GFSTPSTIKSFACCRLLYKTVASCRSFSDKLTFLLLFANPSISLTVGNPITCKGKFNCSTKWCTIANCCASFKQKYAFVSLIIYENLFVLVNVVQLQTVAQLLTRNTLLSV